jgi:hypothetical protein
VTLKYHPQLDRSFCSDSFSEALITFTTAIAVTETDDCYINHEYHGFYQYLEPVNVLMAG